MKHTHTHTHYTQTHARTHKAALLSYDRVGSVHHLLEKNYNEILQIYIHTGLAQLHQMAVRLIGWLSWANVWV